VKCQNWIIILQFSRYFVLLYGVSLIRPAPAELPQDRKIARVGGCSGAMQVAYPFLFFIGHSKLIIQNWTFNSDPLLISNIQLKMFNVQLRIPVIQ